MLVLVEVEDEGEEEEGAEEERGRKASFSGSSPPKCLHRRAVQYI